jgi:hypothetical protein
MAWKLTGYDAFSGEWYPLLTADYSHPLEFETEAQARAAATAELERIEREQPTASSGGQAPSGIQDRVYIEAPDGSRYRWTGADA